MNHIYLWSIFIVICTFVGCTEEETLYDAAGTFEATEITVSSEATGVLKKFEIAEGQLLSEGDKVGFIDTTLLYLQKIQIEAQISSVTQGIPDIQTQTRYFDQQIELARINLSHLVNERDRIHNLVKGEAATQKQQDDIEAQVAQSRQQIQVLKHQKNAQISALSSQKSGIEARPLPLRAQLKEINEKIRRSVIINPVSGKVLSTYAEAGEFEMPGKPLYRIADLSRMHLRAYITGNQYAKVKLNQTVNVLTDDGSGGYHQNTGSIVWISDEAEFTPKTIRTKEERENLVYAIKIAVANEGLYKIGMYGEVKF